MTIDPSNIEAAKQRLQEQMKETPPTFLTVPEAAELARCNPRTIRRAFESGALPAFRPAHRVLLRQSDVVEWVVSRPAAEPRPPARAPRKSRRRPANGKPAPGSDADLREIERNLTR